MARSHDVGPLGLGQDRVGDAVTAAAAAVAAAARDAAAASNAGTAQSSGRGGPGGSGGLTPRVLVTVREVCIQVARLRGPQALGGHVRVVRMLLSLMRLWPPETTYVVSLPPLPTSLASSSTQCVRGVQGRQAHTVRPCGS